MLRTMQKTAYSIGASVTLPSLWPGSFLSSSHLCLSFIVSILLTSSIIMCCHFAFFQVAWCRDISIFVPCCQIERCFVECFIGALLCNACFCDPFSPSALFSVSLFLDALKHVLTCLVLIFIVFSHYGCCMYDPSYLIWQLVCICWIFQFSTSQISYIFSVAYCLLVIDLRCRTSRCWIRPEWLSNSISSMHS